MVTVLTRTIGPVGRDYSSFTLAEADVTNIGTSADLVANDEAIVFEADAGTYSESVTFQSTLTTDATRQVTYRPASGAEHGGVLGAGVAIVDNTTAYGATLTVRDSYLTLNGLSVEATNSGGSRATLSILPASPMAGVRLYGLALSCAGSREVINVAAGFDIGTSSEPIELQNCSMERVTAGTLIGFGVTTTDSVYIDAVNCTGYGVDPSRFFNAFVDTSATLNLNAVNCLSLVDYQVREIGAGTFVYSGSNNFGGSSEPFPASIQGSPYPITATTSFSTPLGSGDYAVYMGATGALADVTGNDVWQQGVGPASNSDVPTTDINGVTRSGTSCNPGAFEADGFVAPTVLTRTIGSGKDYSTFTLAEAAVTSIGSGTDLTFYNEAIVFEADAGTYSETVTFQSSLTSDATRNVTYKPAAGSEHGGVPGAGVHITSSGITTAIRDDYTRLIGLSAYSSGSTVFWQPAGVGSLREDCIGHVSGTSQTCFYSQGGTAYAPHVFRNCVAYTDGSQQAWFIGAFPGVDGYAEAYNCTSMSRWMTVYANAATMNATLVNCMAYGIAFRTQEVSGGTAVVTGSNNFGGSSNPFPAAIQGSPYPITASTAYDPGAGDFALYVGKNGALLDSPNNDVIDQGVGPSANSDVPTTDILGNARSGATANPGAFEVPQATATITKTIGPSGRDYTTFTLAEADVTNIGGSADLVNENERIVFEADAATYNESVTFSSTLVTDATRQVTYKAAGGSEHGGSLGSGVLISSGYAPGTVRIQDDHTAFEGLVVLSTVNSWALVALTCVGPIVRSCLFSGGTGSTDSYVTGSASAPMVYENCVVQRNGSLGFYFADISGGSVISLRNCTYLGTGAMVYLYTSISNGQSIEVINCLSLGAGGLFQLGSTSSLVTGSNNFGPAVNAFPAAIQGSPYPITATTDTSPGAGDWAIYEASNGRLYDVDANDVWKQGVGPASDSDVPLTDILGAPRSGTTSNPGAFETAAVLYAPAVTSGSASLLRSAQVHPQLLAANEGFEAPVWLAADDGSAAWNSPPWQFQYLSWNPSDLLNSGATEYSAYPLRPTSGAMRCAATGHLFSPLGGQGSDVPAHSADPLNYDRRTLRAFLAGNDKDASVNHLGVEAVFAVQQVAGPTTGAITQGRSGSSPWPSGYRQIATYDPSGSTDIANTELGHAANSNTSINGPGGNFAPIGPLPVFNGWLGAGVAVRCGGGHPTISSTDYADGGKHYSVAGVSGYIFLAYPLKNGSAIDLHMKLYRQVHTASGNNGVPTLLASHVQPDGFSLIRFREKLKLRVEVETNASSEVELKCFIFPIKHGNHYDEHQAFKASDWTGETILAGPSGDATVATNTGLVTDSGANAITDHTNKTFGVILGADRAIDINEWTGEHQQALVLEGLHRIALRDLDADDYLFLDRFERVGVATATPNSRVDRLISGAFNGGPSLGGLWLHDIGSQNILSADQKRRALMLLTDGPTDTTRPQPFARTLIDPDPAAGNLAGGVLRMFLSKRPSSQHYNHHRLVSVVGAEDDVSGAANKFALGVAIRGNLGQISTDAVAFFAYYETDGAGNQTYLKLILARVTTGYADDPITPLLTNGLEIASKVVQAVGAAIPTGFDFVGQYHTLQVSAQAIEEITSLENSPAEYLCQLDGNPVVFDTLNFNATQSAVDSIVTQPAPAEQTSKGDTEGFFFWSSLDAIDGSSNSNYIAPRWSDWVEGALRADPVEPPDEGDSIGVQGEGVGTVNLSTAIEHVDWAFRVEYELPRFELAFESGHKHTSPRWANYRRSFSVSATNVTKTQMDALVAFYNARQGIQEAFLFDFPVPDAVDTPSTETISALFQNPDGLVYTRLAEDCYAVNLNLIELV